jgi:hypothetical protein
MNCKGLFATSILLTVILNSCSHNNPITTSNQSLNKSNLIGKWLSEAVSTLDSSGNYVKHYDTLEFKTSSYIRVNFRNVYPAFGWEIGTYDIKLDTIQFSGKDYEIDSLRNVIDSQYIVYNWKCKFNNDSTLEIYEPLNTNWCINKINQ